METANITESFGYVLSGLKSNVPFNRRFGPIQ